MKSLIAKNIKIVRKIRGFSQEEMARKIGTTSNNFYQLESGRRQISIKWMNKIAEALGLHPSQLFQENFEEKENVINAPEVIAIKKYFQANEKNEEILFDKNLLDSIGVKAENLKFIRVPSNAMYPTLQEGDYILFDELRKNIESSGIFAIKINDIVKVKRIIADIFQKKVKIICDNVDKQKFPDYEASLEDANANIEILGKVVWGSVKIN